MLTCQVSGAILRSSKGVRGLMEKIWTSIRSEGGGVRCFDYSTAILKRQNTKGPFFQPSHPFTGKRHFSATVLGSYPLYLPLGLP